jgi:very-short-patch-repair endonuclease
MRQLVAERGIGFRPADSPKSEELARMLEAAGIAVEREYPVDVGGRTFFVDIAIPDFKLAPEYNGGVHDTHSARKRDEWRAGQLRSVGWELLVVTKQDRMRDAVRDVARRMGERGKLPA